MFLNNLTTENEKFWFPQTLWILCKDFFFQYLQISEKKAGRVAEVQKSSSSIKKIIKILVGLTKKNNNLAPNCTCIFGNAEKANIMPTFAN